MRKLILCGVLALGFSMGMLAQKIDSTPTNYKYLALRDAQYEQTMVVLNNEDENDFWKDQLTFENDLRSFDPDVYHTYMKAKCAAYILHAKDCNGNCGQGALFHKMMEHYKSYLSYDSSHSTTHQQNTISLY